MQFPENARVGILLGKHPVRYKNQECSGVINKQTGNKPKISLPGYFANRWVNNFVVKINKTVQYNQYSGVTITMAVKNISWLQEKYIQPQQRN